jgi:hypothetical protein
MPRNKLIEQRIELLSGVTVHYAFVILEIIAVDGLRRSNIGQSDTSKHQVLPVACSNRATATRVACYHANRSIPRI